jgi:hypothetical protein
MQKTPVSIETDYSPPPSLEAQRAQGNFPFFLSAKTAERKKLQLFGKGLIFDIELNVAIIRLISATQWLRNFHLSEANH